MPSPFITETTYTADGTTTNFVVPFPYLEKDDVHVYLNDAEYTSVSWLTDSTIQLAAAPTAGVSVRVARHTDIDAPKVDYADGSTVTEIDLDKSARQEIYALQELNNLLLATIANLESAVISAGGLPAVDNSKNGYILQVVGGVWTLVPTTSVTHLSDYQIDGTALKFQKKTQAVTVVGTPAAVSAWTDVHTGAACPP